MPGSGTVRFGYVIIRIEKAMGPQTKKNAKGLVRPTRSPSKKKSGQGNGAPNAGAGSARVFAGR